MWPRGEAFSARICADRHYFLPGRRTRAWELSVACRAPGARAECLHLAWAPELELELIQAHEAQEPVLLVPVRGRTRSLFMGTSIHLKLKGLEKYTASRAPEEGLPADLAVTAREVYYSALEWHHWDFERYLGLNGSRVIRKPLYVV